MIEEWRDVVGYEGLYQVSNLGRVKRIYLSGKERIRKIYVNPYNGYSYVELSKKDERKQCRL